MKNTKTILIGLLLICSMLFLGGCATQIPPASVGIKYNSRTGISNQILKSQVVYTGWGESVIVYPTSIHNATYVKKPAEGAKQGDDSIVVSTKEGGELPMDVTVAYHVDPANATLMFKNFGTENMLDIQEGFIRYYTAYALNCVTGSKSIFDVISKDRANLGAEVKATLAPIIGSYGITVDDVYIGEVYPSEDLLAKVNERLNKYNELSIERNKLTQADIEAKTMMVEANKQASLNELLAQQNTPEALNLQRLKNRQAAIAKWDGQPPVIGDGTVPFTGLKLK